MSDPGQSSIQPDAAAKTSAVEPAAPAEVGAMGMALDQEVSETVKARKIAERYGIEFIDLHRTVDGDVLVRQLLLLRTQRRPAGSCGEPARSRRSPSKEGGGGCSSSSQSRARAGRQARGSSPPSAQTVMKSSSLFW